ncbi:MAG: SUMF1/EgtB/PvdO family nonheme iron enzyme [Verrucomicrobiota bacterium]|jgi:formylglycine-generating enzyme required for sulfatase activity
MTIKLRPLFFVLALIAGVHQAAAQGTRFFRISGPAATTIAAFLPDGTMVWSNALPGTNYTVQTVTSLCGGTNWVDYVQLPVTTGVNTNLIFAFTPPAGMALIPAGVFTMGDTLDGDTSAMPTKATVSAFYMDVNLVSYSQWQTVYAYATSHGYGFDNAGSGKAANYPVLTVDWYDCVKWCNARSEMEGRTAAYYTDAAQAAVYRTGHVDVQKGWVRWNAGYRLPTEAEWEKAARGGLTGDRFPWGNTIDWSHANYIADPALYLYDINPDTGYDPTFSEGASPVGYFAPNGYGLHDMAGNVWEWCWDWYGSYPAGSVTDPQGPGSGPGRVYRGGSWADLAWSCRVAKRNCDNPPTLGSSGLGFRSVLPPGQP